MTNGRYVPTTPEAQFSDALKRQSEGVRSTSFIVPMLDSDPPEGDPTNLWMRTDGRMRGRYWNGSTWNYVDYPMRADITAPPAVPAAPPAPPKPPAPKTYKTIWTATWTQTYRSNGDKRTDDKGEEMLVYGSSGDSFNGTQRALVGFNYASIAGALAGSTVKKVELRMTNVHAYWNSGVQVYFGIHNVTGEPATWPSGSLPRRRIASHKFGKPETKTVTMPLEFATRIRDGSGKGISIEAPSNSRDFYGFAAGVGSGYTAPQLIVTYAK